MDSSHWPLILIEGVLVFGGALAFGWWQLRSVRRDRERMLAQRAEEERQAQAAATQQQGSTAQDPSSPQAPPPPER